MKEKITKFHLVSRIPDIINSFFEQPIFNEIDESICKFEKNLIQSDENEDVKMLIKLDYIPESSNEEVLAEENNLSSISSALQLADSKH